MTTPVDSDALAILRAAAALRGEASDNNLEKASIARALVISDPERIAAIQRAEEPSPDQMISPPLGRCWCINQREYCNLRKNCAKWFQA